MPVLCPAVCTGLPVIVRGADSFRAAPGSRMHGPGGHGGPPLRGVAEIFAQGASVSFSFQYPRARTRRPGGAVWVRVALPSGAAATPPWLFRRCHRGAVRLPSFGNWVCWAVFVFRGGLSSSKCMRLRRLPQAKAALEIVNGCSQSVADWSDCECLLIAKILRVLFGAGDVR